MWSAVLERSDLSLFTGGRVHTDTVFEVKGKFRMKRIAVLTLLVALGVAWSIPANAQRMSVEENARHARKADKKQQIMNRKATKELQHEMKANGEQQRLAQRSEE